MGSLSKYQAELLTLSDSLDEWDEFVDSSPQGCIFCRSWWLQAVCPESVLILILRENGKVVAGLPLPHRKKWGLHDFHMPKLTPFLGPLLAPPRSPKRLSQISREMELLEALIDAVPDFDRLLMHCSYPLKNWLPFYWAGYEQSTRYTYVIEHLDDLDELFKAMSSSYRNKIRKAKDSGIRVIESEDVEAFLKLNRMTFARQGLELPYSEELVERINKACAKRDARKIFLTKDPEGRIHSSLFVVYNNKSMYNLMQGSHPDLRSSGANILAMWHSIRFAQEVTERYNFEGSMLKNVERVFRDFGAVQKRYFRISKTSSLLLRIYWDIEAWVKMLGEKVR
jgi:hypothetical protein